MILYRDREDAGLRLSRAVARRGLRGGVVLGIPRGGALVAAPVAQELGLPLEALICRKLRCTTDHALAAGALAETGDYFVSPDLPGAERLDHKHLADQLAWVGRQIAAEERALRGSRPLRELKGLNVLLVDDGAATGSTLRAAALAARRRGAARVVAAVPVGPLELGSLLRGFVDELIQLAAPEDFRSMGRYYEDWTRPTVEETTAALSGGSAWPAKR